MLSAKPLNLGSKAVASSDFIYLAFSLKAIGPTTDRSRVAWLLAFA